MADNPGLELEAKDDVQDVEADGPSDTDIYDLGLSRGRGLLRVRGGRGLLRVRGGGRGMLSSFKPFTWTPEVSLEAVSQNMRPQVCRGNRKRGRITGSRLMLGKSTKARDRVKVQGESNFYRNRTHSQALGALDSIGSNPEKSGPEYEMSDLKSINIGEVFSGSSGVLAEGASESSVVSLVEAEMKECYKTEKQIDPYSELSERLCGKPFETDAKGVTGDGQPSVVISKLNDRPNTQLPLETKRFKAQKIKKLLKSVKKNKVIGTKSGKSRSEGLLKAVKMINNGLCVNQESIAVRIPYEILSDRFKKNQCSPPVKESETFLTHDEEKQLIDWALDVSAHGFQVQLTSLRDTALKIVSESGRNFSRTFMPDVEWYDDLQTKYPQLKSLERSKGSLERKEWVTLVANYLAENGSSDILTDLARIFVLEQTVFEYDSCHDLFSGPFDVKNDIACTSVKEFVTVLTNVRGDGIVAPCTLLYKYSSQAELGGKRGKIPGFMVLKSEDGRVQSYTMLEYLQSFHSWLLQEMVQLPVLVLIDGASSQLTAEVWNFCKRNDLILFLSHRDILENLKCSWVNKMMKHDVLQATFVTVLKHSFDEVFKPNHVKAAFKSCGLYSLHPSVKVKAEMEIALQHLERTISPDVLQEFRNAKESHCWTGSPNAELLFYSWLHLTDNASWEPLRTEVEETSCCEITESGGPPQCMWVSCGTCQRRMHVECSSFLDQIEVNDDGTIDTDGVIFVCTECPV